MSSIPRLSEGEGVTLAKTARFSIIIFSRFPQRIFAYPHLRRVRSNPGHVDDGKLFFMHYKTIHPIAITLEKVVQYAPAKVSSRTFLSGGGVTLATPTPTGGEQQRIVLVEGRLERRPIQ